MYTYEMKIGFTAVSALIMGCTLSGAFAFAESPDRQVHATITLKNFSPEADLPELNVIANSSNPLCGKYEVGAIAGFDSRSKSFPLKITRTSPNEFTIEGQYSGEFCGYKLDRLEGKIDTGLKRADGTRVIIDLNVSALQGETLKDNIATCAQTDSVFVDLECRNGSTVGGANFVAKRNKDGSFNADGIVVELTN